MFEWGFGVSRLRAGEGGEDELFDTQENISVLMRFHYHEHDLTSASLPCPEISDTHVPCEMPFSRFPERDRYEYPIAVACL